YYIRDLVAGVISGQAASGVTLTGLSDGSFRIDLDVSSLGSTTGLLRFRLLGGGDFPDDASVTIDDVVIHGTGSGGPPPSAVPAPAGLGVCVPALLTLLMYRTRGRRIL